MHSLKEALDAYRCLQEVENTDEKVHVLQERHNHDQMFLILQVNSYSKQNIHFLLSIRFDFFTVVCIAVGPVAFV